MEKRRKAISYIRFSSEKQLRGDSIGRQTQKAEEYCARKNFELDPTLAIADLGLSAFTGDHIKRGALGKFLGAVRQGLVPPDCVLVVENLDRLSRLDAWATVALLTEILELGVEIHVIDLKEMALVPGKLGDGDLLYVAVSAMRAHDESARKSELGRKAHASRRQRLVNGQDEILHGSVPWWCAIDDDAQKIKAIPERAAVVKQIFEKAAAGFSSYQIARTFNAEGVPTFGRRKNWISFKVRQVIHSNAPLGRLEARIRKGRPAHDFKLDAYYPVIIDEALAASARAVVKRNNSQGRRPKGHLPVNILRGLIRHRDMPMRFANRANGPEDEAGNRSINGYFEAFDETSAQREMVFRIPAAQVESMVLAVVGEITAEELISKDIDPTAGFVASAQEECLSLEKSIARLIEGLARGYSPAISDAIRSAEEKLAGARKRLEEYSIERELRNAAARNVAVTLEQLKELAADGDNVVREKMGIALRRLITRIYVGLPGTCYWDQRADELMFETPGEIEVLNDDVLNFRSILDPTPHSRRRRSLGMKIFFTSGAIRFADRIGTDWRLIPRDDIDGDSDRSQRNIRVVGLNQFVAPVFPKIALPASRYADVPKRSDLDEDIEVPLWLQDHHNRLRPPGDQDQR